MRSEVPLSPEGPTNEAAIARALTELSSHVSGVLGVVAEVADLVTTAVRRGRNQEPGEVNAIHELAEVRLGGGPSIVWGLGFVADPDAYLARGALHWWYRPRRGGAIERLEVSLDPTSVDFYDYTNTPWFIGARDRTDYVTGPYVDAAGTNEHIVTFAHAVSRHGRFLGVAGADVLVGTLQSVMQPAFRDLNGEATLLAPDGLVIVTNSPHLLAAIVSDRPGADDVEVGVPGAPWKLRVGPPTARAAVPEGG